MGYSKIDSFLYDVSLKNYIDFYNQLPKINNIKSDSPLLKDNNDYQNLILMNTNNPPALCHVSKYLKDIPLDKRYYSFYYNNPMFWMIPVETISGNIFGFILKGFFRKDYNWIKYSEISLLFGFSDFSDFKKDDPIILVEGWRDCLYIKQFYKYSLALNTSSLNKGTLELISFLTNKVILILDNDDTGNKMTITNKKMCKDKGLMALSIKPMLKDLGEYFINTNFKNKLVLDLEYSFDFLNVPFIKN